VTVTTPVVTEELIWKLIPVYPYYGTFKSHLWVNIPLSSSSESWNQVSLDWLWKLYALLILLIHLESDVLGSRFDVLMVLKIQVMVFWVVTLCSDVVGYQHLLKLCYPNCQGKVKWRQHCPPNIGIPPHHCLASQPRRP